MGKHSNSSFNTTPREHSRSLVKNCERGTENDKTAPHRSWKQKAEIQVSLETKSGAHFPHAFRMNKSRACGHRPLIKKQKPDTVVNAMGFVLILIVNSHAIWDKSFTLTSGSGYFIYSVKNILITSMYEHVLHASNTANSATYSFINAPRERADWETESRRQDSLVRAKSLRKW